MGIAHPSRNSPFIETAVDADPAAAWREATAKYTISAARARNELARGLLQHDRFVTSTIAPVASGWSGCRVGLAPTGKRHLFTAHTLKGRFEYAPGCPFVRKLGQDQRPR
jgi:hypothetical protein